MMIEQAPMLNMEVDFKTMGDLHFRHCLIAYFTAYFKGFFYGIFKSFRSFMQTKQFYRSTSNENEFETFNLMLLSYGSA